MEDVYVTCPFDKSHRILRARMLTHLTKCKKRYTKQNKMTCPFNPHHIVDKDEFQHHFNTCPARESAIYCPNVNDEDQPVKAPQLLPIVSQPVWDGEEWGEDKWEDEVEIKYDPAKLAVERPVLRIMVGGSRRERKLFREQERLRRAKLENAMEREAKEQNYANDRAGQSVKSTQLKPLISQSEWQSEDAWDEVKWEDDSSVKSFNRGKSEEKPQVRTIIFDEPEKGTKSWKTKEQNYYANDRGSQSVKSTQLKPIVSQSEWESEDAWDEVKWEDDSSVKSFNLGKSEEKPQVRTIIFDEPEKGTKSWKTKEQNYYANDRGSQSVKSTQLKPKVSQSEWQSEDAWDEVKWKDDTSVKSFNTAKSEEKPQVRTIIFDEPTRETRSFREIERQRCTKLENAMERHTKEPNYYANDRESQSVKSTQLKPKVSQSEWQSEDAWDEVKWEDDMSVKREQEPVRRLQPQNFMERWPKAEEKQKELEDDEEEYRPLRRPRNPPIAIASLRAANNRIKTVQNTSAYENKASSNFSFREQERFCRV